MVVIIFPLMKVADDYKSSNTYKLDPCQEILLYGCDAETLGHF